MVINHGLAEFQSIKSNTILLTPKYPIVFINTSNYAMAEHDTNCRLWKWEYVAWEKNSPIVYGEKSRQEIDRSFKPF